MQIYKKYLLNILFFFLLTNASFLLFCQNNSSAAKNSSSESSSSTQNAPSMPKMPSVQLSLEAPSMPKISAPTLGTKFYTPGINQTNISSKTKQDSNSISQTENYNLQETFLNSKEDSLTKQQKAENILNGINPYLTASDVAKLSQNGLFGGIYGLLGNENSLLTNSYAPNASNAQTLKNIMSQLEELKKQNEELKSVNAKKIVTEQASPKSSYVEPKILRFSVNGKNILETCRTVYFSKKENDGSFLLTGDRKNKNGNKNQNETFYFLFKANRENGIIAGYSVEPTIIQDSKDEDSVLFALQDFHDLKAEKTGNLVMLTHKDSPLVLDLLLDIGN